MMIFLPAASGRRAGVGKPRTLADSVTGDTITWSRDSQFVYADSSQGEKPVIERFRVRDGMRSTAVSLSEMQKLPGRMDSWFGLTPDGLDKSEGPVRHSILCLTTKTTGKNP